MYAVDISNDFFFLKEVVLQYSEVKSKNIKFGEKCATTTAFTDTKMPPLQLPPVPTHHY